MGDLKAYSGID